MNTIDKLLTQAGDAIDAARDARFRGRHVDAEANIRLARNTLNLLVDKLAEPSAYLEPATVTHHARTD